MKLLTMLGVCLSWHCAVDVDDVNLVVAGAVAAERNLLPIREEMRGVVVDRLPVAASGCVLPASMGLPTARGRALLRADLRPPPTERDRQTSVTRVSWPATAEQASSGSRGEVSADPTDARSGLQAGATVSWPNGLGRRSGSRLCVVD
jgi:hypothetical protein